MRKNVLFFGLAFLIWASSAPAITYPPDRPLFIGHRGAPALADENTLESLQLAVELGVDMVEFDIQRTRDGVFVLMHDETVNRTTDGTGRVDQMTLEEFKKLKTTSGFTPPTLEQTLLWLSTNEVYFILDFKITDPDQAAELIALVEAHGLLDRAVFESPDPKVVAMVEQMRPDIITAVYPLNMPMMRYYLYKYDIDIASYQYLFVNPLELFLAQKQGKRVIVWTVNSPGLVKWFIKLGVDGIMSDDPRLFNIEE